MKNIPVTVPFLPPRCEFEKLLDGIWERNWLTNNGPLVCELEARLSTVLDVTYLRLVANGTLGLQLAIRGLELEGEVITTPFTYIATASSLVWEKCTPVFVDIDESTLNISTNAIKAAVTNRTSGIMATHVFGNPCDIDEIDALAARFNLKVLYDASHCFGVFMNGKGIMSFGDASVLSLHATKLFHAIEGGAVCMKDEELDTRISLMRNFGHDGPFDFAAVGINAKMSELHAAMGLANLAHTESCMALRKQQYGLYVTYLCGCSKISYQKLRTDTQHNYAYMPIIFEKSEDRDTVIEGLRREGIHPRAYFSPSLDKVDVLNMTDNCKTSQSISSRILCLPLAHTLSGKDIKYVCDIILSV